MPQDDLFRNFNRVLDAVKRGSGGMKTLTIAHQPLSGAAAKLAKVAGESVCIRMQLHGPNIIRDLLTPPSQPELMHYGTLRKKNSNSKTRYPMPSS
jgi:hypothetical protein